MPKLGRPTVFACLCFVFSLFAFGQTPEPAATPPAEADETPEQIFVEEIALNFSAFDRYGQFAPNVRKEDLVIMENGRLLQPTSVRRVPANVLLLLDTSGEIVYGKSTKATRETAKSLIGALRAEDRFAVLQYHNKVETLADWTSDKSSVIEALDSKLGFGKRSVFHEALSAALFFFEKTPRENRHLVLITDGVDSFDASEARAAAIERLMVSEINVHIISYTSLQQAIIEPKRKLRQDGEAAPKRLPEAGVLGLPEHKRPGEKAEVTQRQIAKLPRLNSINLDREMRARQKEDLKKLEQAEKFLKTIAEDANGEMFLPDDYDEMIGNAMFLAETIDAQYVVTYVPRSSVKEAANEVRRIEVSSKREGLRAIGKRKLLIK